MPGTYGPQTSAPPKRGRSLDNKAPAAGLRGLLWLPEVIEIVDYGTVKVVSVEHLSRSRDPRTPAQDIFLLLGPSVLLLGSSFFTDHEGTLAEGGLISLSAPTVR